MVAGVAPGDSNICRRCRGREKGDKHKAARSMMMVHFNFMAASFFYFFECMLIIHNILYTNFLTPQ